MPINAFCCTQQHAMTIRDMINWHKQVYDSNYCERVTAADGKNGGTLYRTTPMAL